MPKPSHTNATSQPQGVSLTHQNFTSIHGIFINTNTPLPLPTSSWETSFYQPTYSSSSHHHHIPTASVTASSSKVQTAPKSQRTQRLTDKITRLQKLVSPYGKTDTASVLLEASITIDALHNQIKNLLPAQFGHLQTYETGEERFKLQSKGLCLVPADCCNSQST